MHWGTFEKRTWGRGDRVTREQGKRTELEDNEYLKEFFTAENAENAENFKFLK
jgi:hypothetical protein